LRTAGHVALEIRAAYDSKKQAFGVEAPLYLFEDSAFHFLQF